MLYLLIRIIKPHKALATKAFVHGIYKIAIIAS